MVKHALFGALTLLAATSAGATSHGEVFKTNKYDVTAYNIKRCTTSKCVIEVTVDMSQKPCAKTNDNGFTVLWLRDIKVWPVTVFWEVKTEGWSFQKNGVKFKKGHPFTNPQKLSNPEGYSVELKENDKPKDKDLYNYGLALESTKGKCEFDPGLVTDW